MTPQFTERDMEDLAKEIARCIDVETAQRIHRHLKNLPTYSSCIFDDALQMIYAPENFSSEGQYIPYEFLPSDQTGDY